MRGYFDPLLARHAAELAQYPRPLAVIVEDLPSPLLPHEARVLLVAALECVDVVCSSGLGIDERSNHEAIRRSFIERVHERSKA